MPGPASSFWRIRGRTLDLSSRPLVMGILNVTPDSFSDGGEHLALPEALRRGAEMVAEGADLLDIGGESTRPGAEPVGVAEELARVVPVIEALAARFDLPLSVDTTKGEVAREALAAGAHIVNDVSGLCLDPAVASEVAGAEAGLVLMHRRGEPRTMQEAPHYDALIDEIRAELARAVARARAARVKEDALVLDPGIGFGKTFRHNWEVLSRLEELTDLGRPLLVGTSRKAFLRALVGEDRRALEVATVTTNVAAWSAGARVWRVHDVRAHRLAANTLATLWAARSGSHSS